MFDVLKRKNSYSFNDGSLAMERGDREKARDIWIEVGRAGDSRAQFALAAWYTDETEHCVKSGSDPRSSVQQALDWGTKAAEQGHIDAQVWLGRAVQSNGWIQQKLQTLGKADQALVLGPFEMLWRLQLTAYEGRGLSDHDLGFLQSYWALEYLTRYPRGITNFALFIHALDVGRNGDHEQSLICLRRLVDLNPEFREAYHFLGTLAMLTPSDHEAITAFRKAVSGKRLFGRLTEFSWAALVSLYKGGLERGQASASVSTGLTRTLLRSRTPTGSILSDGKASIPSAPM